MTRAVRWNSQADEGVRLFNARRFFEAHDVFEEIWMERVGEERLFYQGLIQVAVGFYKIEMQNLAGARSLLRKGLAKLEGVRTIDAPLAVETLIEEAGAVLARLLEIDQAHLAAFDRESLPRLHYRDGAPPG